MKEKKKTQQKKRLVLLDAHAIIHRAYHALPDFSTSTGEPTGGLYGVSAMLLKIIQELRPDYIVACYDLPEPTFRHEAYEEYKAGRQKADDALVAQIERSRDIFSAFHIPIYDHPGFEADDILGTIVEQTKNNKDLEVVIASGDMDTLQLAEGTRVKIYTLRKGLSDTVMYDERAVKERFSFSPTLLADFKGLRGDPSDNIIGIAGIGEKTATTLITAFGSIEDIYEKLKKDQRAFEEKGVKPRIINLLIEGEEEAIFSKTLATIRRDAPISFTLPKKTFRDAIDLKSIENLFTELEFRSLSERARALLANGEDAGGEKKEEEIDEEEVRHTGIALWLLRSDITTPELPDILYYAKTDSFAEAKKRIFAELKKEHLDTVYEDIELPIVPIIKKAQERGILVDTAHLSALSKKYHAKLDKKEKAIFAHAGVAFNVNSPKQLGEVLFDTMGISTKGLKKTAGGARSTRESELRKLADEHEIVSEILDYRELQKLLSTYIDNIPHMLGGDGRLHTTLNQTGTTTGRFSSTNPNLQNIPVRGEMGKDVRNAFVAADGHVLMSFDYSQIEMRMLAALANDEKLIEVFKNGEDVHTSVAAHVFGVAHEEVTKDMRRKAKVINFGIIYGMGVNALRENLGGTRAEAQEFYNNYFEKFPTIAGYFESVRKGAREQGFVETHFGRRRYLEGIRSSIPYIRANAERQATNAPLQGTAADIIKIAMKRADDTLKAEGLDDAAHLLLQIHDELLFEVRTEDTERVGEVVKRAMEEVAEFSVPLVVDVEKGARWGELSK